MSLRVLLLLTQLPQDPASGAARSMRTIAQFLGEAGMTVAAVGTTATEAGGGFNLGGYLREMGVDAAGDILRFEHGRVTYVLLNTGQTSIREWEGSFASQFDGMFDQMLAEFRPDIVLTYGGTSGDMARRRRARERGCKVVFGLRNFGYLRPGAFEDVDAVLTGSAFLSDRYRAVLGIESTPLPLPLDFSSVVSEEHERIFVTYINPSVEKGVFFAARLFEELSTRRGDIPILVVESRGTAGSLLAAGMASGFDLRRHGNLMVSAPVGRPAEIYRVARTVIAPSVWEEPAGRVAAEAIVNGIPPVVSNRGGLAEICGEAGFIFPLPDDLTIDTRVPIAAELVQEWADLLIRLTDDEDFYSATCARSRSAAHIYSPERLRRQYAEFFRSVCANRRD